MEARINRLGTGMLTGLLLPLISLLVFYLVSFSDLSIGGFFDALAGKQKVSSIISLCAVPNLLLFFIFIWLNYLYAARGVLAATFMITVIVVATKFLV